MAMSYISAMPFAVGGSAGAKFAPPLYLNALSWEEVLTMLVILVGIIFVGGYILSIVMSKDEPPGPPDTQN